MPLKEQIKAAATQIGFDLVGVTTPDPLLHYERYLSWLEHGYHGEMAYMATETARFKRRSPRLVEPDCHSILVLGKSYPAPLNLSTTPLRKENKFPTQSRDGNIPVQAPTGLTGQVAAYAWGEDYHLSLPRMMRALLDQIENLVGKPFAQRIYTDTGPLLERELGQRAGLGWIGKNSCLINPQLGSFFLPAEILLGLEIEPDQPFSHNRCGSCTCCLQACPTNCLLLERTLDARLCISYLTIELRGKLPLELRPKIGNWVFGCDICQQVCPWNWKASRNAVGGSQTEAASFPFTNLDLLRELHHSPESIAARFRSSPIKRLKRHGYLRNLTIVLGNLGNPSAMPDLSQVLLHHPEALVRAHAAWALGRLGGQAARSALETAMANESDPEVRAEIRSGLEMICQAM